MYKKLLCFLSFFILLFLFTTKIFAFDQFIKYEENPLQLKIDTRYSTIRQAHLYKIENSYEGIITLFDSFKNKFILSLISSLDGINWKFKKEIFINDESQEFSNPRVFIDENGNKHLFFAKLENNNILQIYYLKCDKDFNCQNHPKLIITPDSDENSGVFAPYVIKIGNIFYIFYGSWGQRGFSIRIGYSSSNLENWEKCPKKILSGYYDGSFILQENNSIYLFYHRSDKQGIGYAETSLPLNCDSVFNDKGIILTPTQTYDQNHLIYPSLIKENNRLRLYYTGASNSWGWSLNFACSGFSCNSIYQFHPVILLPGLMASWNGKAIIHNQEVSIFDWKIPSFVKEYTGIITSLKNLGYQENQDFFVFPYDWRKPVEQTTVDLNTFLQQKIWQQNPDQKVNLVGHSLGGLIARIFTQKNKDKVNQIISIGSPHQGVIQVYKPLEAGEIDQENTLLWLAQKLILVLNKTGIEPDRETIKKRFPVALDLFPTFNFLKDKNGREISIDSLSIKNNTLLTYNSTFSQIFDIFTAIYGEKDEKTPAGYKIESPSVLDQLLGNYPDGKPIDIWYEKGDYTVLSKSANQDSDSQMLNFDHGEIITEKESIKKIFDTLHIDYSDDKIASGQKTKISPSLIFLIHSPAKMKVLFGGKNFEEEDGIIFIPEAQEGNYHLQVQGINLGKYTVIVGQISQNNDLWEKIEGEITKTPPESQIDSYLINFNPQTANSIFPTPTPTNLISPTPKPSSIPTTTTTVSPNPNTALTPTPTKTSSLTPTPTTTQSSTQNQTTNQTSNLTSSYNNQSISSYPSPTSVLFSSIKNQSSKEEVMGEKTKDEVKKIEEKPTPKKNNFSSIEIAIPIVVSLISIATLIIKKKILKKET